MKDLTSFLMPDLELKLGGHTYTCPPPTQGDGLRLAAIVSAGTTAAGGGQIDEDTTRLLAQMDDVDDIARIALGTAAYEQMVKDGVPGPHITQAGTYAMYYWVLGGQTADAMFETMYGDGGAAAPKAQPTGRSTASGNRTRTASTRATGSRRAKSAAKPPAKASKSPGKASSTTSS